MKKYFVISLLVVLSLALTGMANASSIIGTNMSTTGTFTQTVGSATAALFQDAAGTITVLAVDTAKIRVGVGAAASTTFEVQGTASASYFFTQNTIQIAGVPGATASVAYSRFGTGTTGHSLAAADDILVSGLVEFDDNVFFDAKVGIGGTGPSTTFEVQGTASASFFFTQNGIQVAGAPGATASVTWSRFGTGTAGHTVDINASNDVLISGALEVDGKSFFDGTASVGSDFEAVGYVSASQGFFKTDLVVGHNVASSSTIYSAEFGGGTNTATVSVLFGGSAASTKGTCFQFKDAGGTWVYARVLAGGTEFTINNIKCHQ